MSIVSQERLDATWRAISFELDAPRRSWTERALRAVRTPDHVARVVAATPALRRSWFIALALVVLVGLVALDDTDPRSSVFVLLFLAPLAPVGGVALAFGSWADPAHELHVTTPMHGLRLLAIRSVTVLAVSFASIAGASVIDEATRPYSVLWLLPALAVTALALAFMTVTTPTRAALAAASVWVVAAFAGRAGSDELTAFSGPAQLAALGSAVAALAVVWLRRDRFDVVEVTA